MLRKSIVFATLVACLAIVVSAEDPTPTPVAPENPPATEEAIVAQVQMEEYIARKWLDIVFRLQYTQSIQSAGALWVKASGLELEENNLPRNMEENIFFDVDRSEVFGERFDQINHDQSKLDLLATYHLLRADKMKMYQAIFSAGELQREFFLDRAMQHYLPSIVESQPQLAQLFYIKVYSTMLKTFRLSYNFQYLNHFDTWMEDALDLDVSLVSGGSSAIYDQARDKIAREKFWAFHAFQNFAILEYQIFFVDSYLESAFTGGSLGGGDLGSFNNGFGSFGTAPPPSNETSTAFLEEEAQEKPSQSQSQFIPFMMYNSSPNLYMKLYRLYFVLYQMQAATAGFQSTMIERAAYNNEDNLDMTEEDIKTQAQRLFVAFAQNLSHAASLEYLTTIFELYSIFAPAVAGSFAHGSMGQGSV